MANWCFENTLKAAAVLAILLLLCSPLRGQESGEKDQDQAGDRRDFPALTEGSEPALVEVSLGEIEEFEILFGPELSSGGGSGHFSEIVNPFKIRTRGRFFGSIYEFHRNDNLDARNFFDPVGQPLPEFKRNQFGGSFGASVTGRLKVFGTFDGLRINRGSTLLSHIPSSAMKRGDFSDLGTVITNPFTGEPFENNVIPDSMIHPVARRMLAEIPDPNRDDPDRNYVNNQPVIENEDTFSGRVDYEHSQDTKIFGQYNLTESNGVNVSPLPSFGTTEESRAQDLSLEATRNFSPTFVTSLQLNLRRTTFTQLASLVDQQGLLASLGIAGVSKLDDLDEGYPEFRLDGYASLGLGRRNESPRTFFNNDLEFSGNFTYTPNDHQLSFGAEVGFRQINNNRSGGLRRGRFAFSGIYTGDAFADFLLGIPDSATRALGSDRSDLRRRTWKVFLRDDWRINPKFSLSLSVTYNYFSPYRSVHDNVSTFWPLVFDPPVDGELVVTGSQDAARVGLGGLGPGEAVYPDRNDWAPGIGLAYSPLGNNSLVIRSSYQISYDPLDDRDALETLGRNFPFYFIEEADGSAESPDLDLARPFDAAAHSELTIRGIDPFIRNAYIQQWRLSLQNQFLRNWTLQLSYGGRKSTRLNRDVPANVPLPGPGPLQERRPNPLLGRFEILSGGGSSIGHRLEAEIEKHFSRGFSLQSGFSWDRTFTDLYFGDPNDPRNLRQERGLSGRFPPKQLFLDYIWDLPMGPERAFSTAWAGPLRGVLEGWRLSGRTSIQSGRPITPQLSGDPNNDGVRGDRPDRIGSGLVEGSNQSIDRWFEIGDFAEPSPYTIGNSGRSILLGPMRQTWDISLIKRTALGREGSVLEFRVQFFNAFNHTNFDQPEDTFGTSTFGQIFGAEEAREIEIALKYSF